MPKTKDKRSGSTFCRTLRSWWRGLFEPRIENDITRNSEAICRLGKKLEQNVSEVLERVEREESERQHTEVNPVFDFESVKGQRWRVISTGWSMPPGCYSVEFEWENGVEVQFSSFDAEGHSWGEEWMESHEDNESFWDDSPLPEWLTRTSEWHETERTF